MMERSKIKNLLLNPPLSEDVLVKGWVRTKRGNKNIVFIALNDGSTINNIQVVADAASFSEELFKDITTGACLAVTGRLVESQGKGQNVEINASVIEIYGKCDAGYLPASEERPFNGIPERDCTSEIQDQYLWRCLQDQACNGFCHS